MDQEPKHKLYNLYEGVHLPLGIPEETFRSAVDYKPKKGDIIIVTYPKCGTTWMQYIVLSILRHGKASDDPLDFFLGCPYIEMTGAEAVDYMIRPGAMKTHLPYDRVPKSKEAKYIYVCRDPKDCVVSFYYNIKDFPFPGFKENTFDEFFEFFIRGEVPYGDYFEHIKAWYEHKDDPNVYFVTYENLKKDTKGEILKLAKFLGKEYEDVLLNDTKILDDVIKHSSFDYLKKIINEAMKRFMKGTLVDPAEGRKLPAGLKKTMDAVSKLESEGDPSLQFVRKGIVGDWKNHFNSDQLKRLEEKMAEKTANSDVMKLWQ